MTLPDRIREHLKSTLSSVTVPRELLEDVLAVFDDGPTPSAAAIQAAFDEWKAPRDDKFDWANLLRAAYAVDALRVSPARSSLNPKEGEP